jgi:hypothetical protein
LSPAEESTFDIVLTRDVTQVGEIYNNYGRLSNDQLLTRYGFIIPNNPANSVEMRRCLFDEIDSQHISVIDERREYWKANGFELSLRLSQFLGPARIGWNDILESNPPVIGSEFVDWSLCITTEGWPSYPTQVWLHLISLSHENWRRFRNELNGDQIVLNHIMGTVWDLDAEEHQIIWTVHLVDAILWRSRLYIDIQTVQRLHRELQKSQTKLRTKVLCLSQPL